MGRNESVMLGGFIAVGRDGDPPVAYVADQGDAAHLRAVWGLDSGVVNRLVERVRSFSACVGAGEHLTDDEREGLGYVRAALEAFHD